MIRKDILALAFLSLSALCLFAHGPGAPSPTVLCTDPQPQLKFDDFTVYQPPALAEPAPRVPFRDPVFGACVVRVTDRLHDVTAPDTSGGMKNEYSRVQSFNADESRLLVRSTSAYWYLYDAATLQPIAQMPFQGAVDPRWDATDPNLLYYIDEGTTNFMKYNTQTAEQALIRDFAGDFSGWNILTVSTRYEGSPSLDGRFWGFMAEDQNWTPVAFLVYDQQLDQVTAKRDMRGVPGIDAVDSVTISPLGDYFLAYFDYCRGDILGTDANPCGLMVYDARLQNGRGVIRNVGHTDAALDAQGREVVVYQQNDTDHISVVDIATGANTDLYPIDFSFTPIGLHLSGRAFRLPGWASISTHDFDAASHTWMDDEVFAVELKTGGRQVRLAHTHSIVDPNQEHDYWAEPQASTNRDLTRVLFTSNWGRSGTDQVDMYMIDLPQGWAGCSVSCSATVPAAAQVNTSVSFTGSASAPGCTSALVYDWNFGDGSAHASQRSPAHTYAQTGTFTWTFKASSGSESCTKTGSITVSTELPCTLECTAVPPTNPVSCTPVSFQATATSSGCTGTVSYDWDFGDGTPHSSEQNPSHKYADAGAFTWTLTAAADTVVCTKTGSITVTPSIVISSVSKAGNPFRLKICGAGFHEGLQVFIGDDTTPWPYVKFTGGCVTIKGGKKLKARLKTGQPVTIRIVNPDCGEVTIIFERL